MECAALYMNGDGETWSNSLVLSKGAMSWADFKEKVCDRFGDVLMEDVVEEFTRTDG